MRGVTVMVMVSSLILAGAPRAWSAQDPAHPVPGMVDTPTVKILRGLTVPEFEAEMQLMNQALGVSCGHCHVRGNFASEANPRKAAARRMLEMARAINTQFFPDYKPADGESKIGKVTCYTCHQGSERPKTLGAMLHE
jgi:photosynthetic reaction center cytochrome c subunit